MNPTVAHPDTFRQEHREDTIYAGGVMVMHPPCIYFQAGAQRGHCLEFLETVRKQTVPLVEGYSYR